MEFTAPVGPTVEIPSSPSEILYLFFTDQVWDTIVTESNKYAEQVMFKKHSTNEMYDAWTKITEEEIRAYIGMCLLMSINHLPSLRDYWSKDPFDTL